MGSRKRIAKIKKKVKDDLFSASGKEEKIQEQIKERLKKYVDREKEKNDNKA